MNTGFRCKCYKETGSLVETGEASLDGALQGDHI